MRPLPGIDDSTILLAPASRALSALAFMQATRASLTGLAYPDSPLLT